MHLLYAEDEEDLNRIVTKKLTEEGFSVDSCFNGREAIDNVQFTEYDAAIPDIMNKTKKFLATLALCGLIIANGATSSVLAADKIISQSAAVSAAYKKAGVTKSQVSALEVEYDADDDEYGQVYEVEFKANGYKYKYEIDANNGTILKSTKKKLKTTVKTTTSKSSAYIGVKAAKAVALKHAKLTGTKVTYTKAKLTKEDGIKVYDIEFRTATTEYEYEINAKTGKVVEFSVEPIDYDDED